MKSLITLLLVVGFAAISQARPNQWPKPGWPQQGQHQPQHPQYPQYPQYPQQPQYPQYPQYPPQQPQYPQQPGYGQLPKGSYQLSCNSCRVQNGMLQCSCQTIAGYWVWSSMPAYNCSEIANIDGQLTCWRP